MDNTVLNDNDHIARYCSPRHVEDDGSIAGEAFKLRPSDDYLSVNWVEFFRERSLTRAVGKIRKHFFLKGFDLKRNGRFAILNVGETKSAGRIRKLELQVKHIPDPPDYSHAGIFGYTINDIEISEDIAHLVKQDDLYPSTD